MPPRDDSFDEALLARNPRAFFGLAEGFGEADLRRAYLAAIRRFRPETHPREFQRIREARDRLASWIDAGALGPPPMDASGPLLHGLPGGSRFDTPAGRRELLQRLASAPTTPRDFVVLALLADTVHGAEPGFEAWLLAGLDRHPEDEGLVSILRCHCQDGVPDSDLPRFLRRAASALPATVLWTVTRSAWARAADVLPFVEFRQLWEQCADPEDLDEEPRARLLHQLLPRLACDGEPDWIAAQVQWLESLPEVVDHDGPVLDALEAWAPVGAALRRPRRAASAPAGGPRRGAPAVEEPSGPARFPRGPAADLARSLLEAIVKVPSPGGDARLAEAARRVVAAGQEIALEFRPPQPKLAAALRRVPRAAVILGARVPRFSPERSPVEEARLVLALHDSLKPAIRGSFTGFLRGLIGFVVGAWGTLALLVWFVLAGAFFVGLVKAYDALSTVKQGGPSLFGGIALALGSIVIAILCLVLVYRLIRRAGPFHSAGRRWAESRWQRRAYRLFARERALRAVTEMGLDPGALVDETIVPVEQQDPILVRGVAEDPALPILWLAHRFAV
jgi:hypothetical protein